MLARQVLRFFKWPLIPVTRQAQHTECGVAALKMLLGHHGRYPSLEALREATGVSRAGCNARTLIQGAKHFDLDLKAIVIEPDKLRNEHFPLIAFLSFRHFTLIEAIEDGWVYKNDPHLGRTKHPFSSLDDTFTGVVLVCASEPSLSDEAPPPLFAPLLERLEPFSSAILIAFSLAVVSAFSFGLALQISAEAMGVKVLAMDGIAICLLLGVFGVATWWQEHTLSRTASKLSIGETRRVLRHMTSLPFSFFAYRLPRSLHGIVNNCQDLGLVLSRAGHRIMGALHSIIFVTIMSLISPAAAASIFFLILGYGFVSATLRRNADILKVGRMAEDPASSCHSGTVISQIESYKTGGLEVNYLDETVGMHALGTVRQQRRDIVEAAELGLDWLYFCIGLLTVILLTHNGWQAYVLSLANSVAIIVLAVFALIRSIGIGGLIEDWRVTRDLLAFADDVLGIPVADASEPVHQVELAQDLNHSASLSVSLSDIVFGYSRATGQDIHEVSLNIEAGMVVGFTGATGCGKSTLARIIAGFHSPWSGSVCLGGIPLDHWPRETLRSAIGLVDKSILLFPGTLRENLCMWDNSIPDCTLERALEDAGLKDVLLQRGEDLNAPVLEQGLNFSGGQRQRIELARVLARGPRLLIIDEANDALEVALEAEILARLRARGLTLIIISHRQETLAACDRVLTFYSGKLISDSRPAKQIAIERTAFAETEVRLDTSEADNWNPPAAVNKGLAPGPEARTLTGSGQLAAVFNTVASQVVPGGTTERVQLRESGKRSLYDMARTHHMYLRRISLPRDWRMRDPGAVVAFRRGDESPVAVVPRFSGNARILDPVCPDANLDGIELSDDAYSLYPNLPDEPATSRDLWRLAFDGSNAGIVAALWTCIAFSLACTTVPVAAWWIYNSDQGNFTTTLSMSTMLTGLLSGTLLLFAFHLTVKRMTTRANHLAVAAFWARFTRLPIDFIRSFRSLQLGDSVGAVSGWMRRTEEAWSHVWIIAPLYMGSVLLYQFLPSGLFLIATVFVPLATVCLYLAHRNQLNDREIQASTSTTRSLLLDVLLSMRRQQGSSRRHYVIAEWEKSLLDQHALMAQQQLRNSLIATLLALIPFVTLIAMLAVLASASGQALLPGHVVVLIIAATGLAIGTHGLIKVLTLLIARRSHSANLDEVLQVPTEHAHHDQRTNLYRGRLRAQLSTTNLTLRYSNKAVPVIQSVSIDAMPGEVTIIKGPSGSGKSTLLRAIMNYIGPEQGKVVFDGIDASAWHLETLRSQIGAVWQTDEVWEGMILDNITGSGPFSLEEAWQALQAVELADEVYAMAWKIKTIVSENTLSTGQKQRLLLARQLIRNPRLLILDEATSALDDRTEARIFDNIRRLGITCIGTAHRESTLSHADRVYTMTGGRITDCVTYVHQAVSTDQHSDTDNQAIAPQHPAPKGGPSGSHVKDLTSTRIFRKRVLDRFLTGREMDQPRFINKPPLKSLMGGSLLAGLLVCLYAMY